MRRSLPSLIPWATVLAASAVAFVLIRLRESETQAWSWGSPAGHFWIVSSVSIACAVLAAIVGTAALRATSWRVTSVALSFIAMSGIFAVHGLATPGFIVESPQGQFYNVIGVSSRLAILAAVLLLGVANVPLPPSLDATLSRHRRLILFAGAATVVLYAFVSLTWPQTVPSRIAVSPLAWGTTIAVALIGGAAAVRLASTYRATGIELHGATAVALVLIIQAQFSLQLGATWSGTFWLYHFQLLAAFTAILWGLAVEYSSGHAWRAIDSLTVADVLEQLRASLLEPVAALATALEARDGYTLGHGERVAALAVLIGREMQLPTRTLRSLIAGALLHDVGKIGVPDSVLHKRGPLDELERLQVEEHPLRGAEMLRKTLGDTPEADIIRHHHEHWDGGGYPDGLRGTGIPLVARITCVADVYDALRSNRAYREALTPAEAQEHIVNRSGDEFDPDCVEAFLRVVAQWEHDHSADTTPYVERRGA